MFENKIKKDRPTQDGYATKYPNIELKRCFDAKKFKQSNEEITKAKYDRQGTLRSHVQTTVPKKRLQKLYNGFDDADELEEGEDFSESQY